MYPAPPPRHRPAGPSVGWAVALWVVAAAAVVGAGLCAFVAVVGFGFDSRIDDTGIMTTATVTEVSKTIVTVEFTARPGEQITTDLIWWPSEYPAIGDRVEIMYDPQDPYYAVQAGSIEDQTIAFVFAAAAAFAVVVGLAAAIGAVLVHRARTKAARG